MTFYPINNYCLSTTKWGRYLAQQLCCACPGFDSCLQCPDNAHMRWGSVIMAQGPRPLPPPWQTWARFLALAPGCWQLFEKWTSRCRKCWPCVCCLSPSFSVFGPSEKFVLKTWFSNLKIHSSVSVFWSVGFSLIKCHLSVPPMVGHSFRGSLAPQKVETIVSFKPHTSFSGCSPFQRCCFNALPYISVLHFKKHFSTMKIRDANTCVRMHSCSDREACEPWCYGFLELCFHDPTKKMDSCSMPFMCTCLACYSCFSWLLSRSMWNATFCLELCSRPLASETCHCQCQRQASWSQWHSVAYLSYLPSSWPLSKSQPDSLNQDVWGSLLREHGWV